MAKRKVYSVTTTAGEAGTRSTFNAAAELARKALHDYALSADLPGEWVRTIATIEKADGFHASGGVREWVHPSGKVFTATIKLNH